MLLQPLNPLMAAVCEVSPLGDALLVVSAGWLGNPCLSKGVLKVLAGEAHHEGPVSYTHLTLPTICSV